MFILHSRKSELYRYVLDRTSALSPKIPFNRVSTVSTCGTMLGAKEAKFVKAEPKTAFLGLKMHTK